MPKKPSLESRLIAMQELLANDASRAGQRMTNLENALCRVGEALQDATSRMDKRLGEIERATRRDVAAGGGYDFSDGVTAAKMQSLAEGRLLGRDNPGVIDQRAQLRERADELLEQTSPWGVGAAVPSGTHASVGASPQEIERVNKALNGDFSSYEPGSHRAIDLMTLSLLVNLRKQIDRHEKLLRFLVDRAGDGK